MFDNLLIKLTLSLVLNSTIIIVNYLLDQKLRYIGVKFSINFLSI